MDVTRPIGLCLRLVDQMRTRSPTFGSNSIDVLLSVEPQQRAVLGTATAKDYRTAERVLVSVKMTADKTVVAPSNCDL